MNSITTAGQLGRDAEMRFLPNGDPICTFSVADNQSGKDKPTIWWNCSIFGKRAESLSPYLLKGQQVTVSGALTKREWQDKEGNKREALDLRVADLALQGRPQGQQEAPQQRQAAKAAAQSRGDSGFDDLDVPF